MLHDIETGKRKRRASSTLVDAVPSEDSDNVPNSSQQSIRPTDPQSRPTPSNDTHIATTRSSSEARTPLHRAPQAAFYPEALHLWVFEDEQGRKTLVPELVPGSRHWRIGDPHVEYCVVCDDRGDALLGCYTCKRSYHQECLGGPLEDFTPGGQFHCGICISRFWHVEPPRDILSLGTEVVAYRQSTSNRHAAHQPLPNPSRPLLPALGPAVRPTELQTRQSKRRSKFQTISDEADQAISTIYRELESVVEVKAATAALQRRITELEQEQRMQAGQFSLERQQLLNRISAHSTEQYTELESSYARLVREHEDLKKELELAKAVSDAKSREIDEIKASVRGWLNR